MDMSDRYSDLKIIAIGAVDTAREVVEYDAEMRNRVSEIHVPLMQSHEIRQIPEKGQALLNFRITSNVEEDLVRSSNGLASACHQLCLNMCFAADINVTLERPITLGSREFKTAVEQYLAGSSDTLRGAFDKAFRHNRKLKFDDSDLIVKALLQVDQDGVNRNTILEKIRNDEPDYPSQRLSISLLQLQKEDRGLILRYDSSTGRYSFKDPFYRAYALAHNKREIDEKEKGVLFVSSDFEQMVAKLFAHELTQHQIDQIQQKMPPSTGLSAASLRALRSVPRNQKL